MARSIAFQAKLCYSLNMIISYHGLGCIKAQLGDKVIAFNPISKEASQKYNRFGSDIAMISLNHPDYNGVENVWHGDKAPFIVDGPGEYEVGGVYIKGVPTEGDGGVVNTVYSVLFDDINLCHLGALSVSNLKPEVVESLGEIDILFVPIGGGAVLEAEEAYKLSTSLEPKIIVPLHNGKLNGKGSPINIFLEEEGEEGLKPLDKLTIKKKDLTDKEAEIVLLAYESS